MIINLSDNFEPYGKGIEYKKFNFPSGCEPHIKFSASDFFTYESAKRGLVVIITTRIHSMNDFMLLLLATDALKRMGIEKIEVFISYLPFARQDRVMVPGEPLSVKVIADILNLQGYKKVQVYDPHSEVCLALINNSEGISNHGFVGALLGGKTDYLIVSPDAGAYKKIFKLCQYLHYNDEIVLCNKLRDVSNGTIRSLTCSHEDLKGKDVYIVDDIADGGGTFILLAQILKEKNAGRINLIVSHGIFSKGIDVFQNIDHIYTTNSFSDLPENIKLTQIKLKL